jgi:hypothetical protein
MVFYREEGGPVNTPNLWKAHKENFAGSGPQLAIAFIIANK